MLPVWAMTEDQSNASSPPLDAGSDPPRTSPAVERALLRDGHRPETLAATSDSTQTKVEIILIDGAGYLERSASIKLQAMSR